MGRVIPRGSRTREPAACPHRAPIEQSLCRRRPLGEDVLVVADAVLDGVDQTVGHGPAGSLVEGNGSHVLDSGVQLEVRVAVGRDRGFADGQKSLAEALALVVWCDEQVDQLVAADGDVGDRFAVEDG